MYHLKRAFYEWVWYNTFFLRLSDKSSCTLHLQLEITKRGKSCDTVDISCQRHELRKRAVHYVRLDKDILIHPLSLHLQQLAHLAMLVLTRHVCRNNISWCQRLDTRINMSPNYDMTSSPDPLHLNTCALQCVWPVWLRRPSKKELWGESMVSCTRVHSALSQCRWRVTRNVVTGKQW